MEGNSQSGVTSAGRGRGGSPAGPVVAAVDPGSGQPGCAGRDVVVEQALGGMQQLALGHAEPPGLGQQGVEVAGDGL